MFSNATATRSVAYNTIVASDAISPITSEMYNTNEYNAFHKGILRIQKRPYYFRRRRSWPCLCYPIRRGSQQAHWCQYSKNVRGTDKPNSQF